MCVGFPRLLGPFYICNMTYELIRGSDGMIIGRELLKSSDRMLSRASLSITNPTWDFAVRGDYPPELRHDLAGSVGCAVRK